MTEHKRDKNSLIVAFGNLACHKGAFVPADQIAARLLGSNRWFSNRKPGITPLGAKVLFYQNGLGVVASGIVEQINLTTPAEVVGALGFPAAMLYVWRLRDISNMKPAISLRGLVQELRFITNKRHWGQSLRYTPRWIWDSDFDTIANATR